MDLGLIGRRAAVSAGTSGLGLAIATALAAEGAVVTICGRNAERARSAAESIGASWVVCDLDEPAAGARFVEAASSRMGGVDILVANTSGPPAGALADFDADAYRAAFDRCAVPVIDMCRAAVPGMRMRTWGRIIVVTSVAVRTPMPGLALSMVARSGLTAYLTALSDDVANEGVTVNSLQPGLHATARVAQVYEGDKLETQLRGIPAGRMGKPEDFGSIAAFLASDRAGYVTGTTIAVDGGLSRRTAFGE